MNPWWCDRNAEPIVICKSTDHCGAFLNMASGYPIEYDDHGNRIWLTSEHLYQAHRFEDIKLRDYISRQPNGYLAKQAMKRLRDEGCSVSEELWDLVKLTIMEMCVRLKFEQHENLRKQLISTYPVPLVELSTKGDLFWGTEYQNGKLVGKNNLGKLLMKIRLEFMDQPKLDLQ